MYKVDLYRNNKKTINLYYKRFLYINKEFIYKTVENNDGLKKIRNKDDELDDYDAYNNGKIYIINSYKLTFGSILLVIFDMDIISFFKVKGLKGKRYFLTIINRSFRIIWIYLFKFKADVYDVMVDFYNMIIN